MDLKTKAGDRLKGLRLLIGLTQDEMAEMLELPFTRYRNVEGKKARMAEDEFSAVCARFPEFALYLTYEGNIDFDALKASQEKLVKLAAAAIEAGRIPEGYFLEEKIK